MEDRHHGRVAALRDPRLLEGLHERREDRLLERNVALQPVVLELEERRALPQPVRLQEAAQIGLGRAQLGLHAVDARLDELALGTSLRLARVHVEARHLLEEVARDRLRQVGPVRLHGERDRAGRGGRGDADRLLLQPLEHLLELDLRRRLLDLEQLHEVGLAEALERVRGPRGPKQDLARGEELLVERRRRLLAQGPAHVDAELTG